MRVAAVQFCPVFKDLAGNTKRLARLIVEAAGKGAKLVVLPELCTTGYSFMSRADAEPYAEVLEYPSDAEHSSFRVFRALAIRHSVHIAWGLIEKGVGTGNLFNSQVLMCPDGNFESYQKVNHFGNDWLWSSAGRASPPVRRVVVDGKAYRIGLLICRDIRDKSDKHDTLYEPGDADIVAYSANWGDGGFPANAWMSFAKGNRTTLVVSNRYGHEENNNFGEGGICIIRPDQSVTCEGLVWNKDCIVYGEV
jgi:predicted amidohydrolase